MKTQLTKALFIFSLISVGFVSQAQCYLELDGSTTVEDNSLENKKTLWNACINRRLAQLDPQHPSYFEMGQNIGDDCLASRIRCQE